MPDTAPDPTTRPVVIPRGIATNLGLAGGAAAVIPVVVDLIKDGKLPDATIRLLIIVGGALAAVGMIGRFWQAGKAIEAQAVTKAPRVPSQAPQGASSGTVVYTSSPALTGIASSLMGEVTDPATRTDDYRIADEEGVTGLQPDDPALIPPDEGDGSVAA